MKPIRILLADDEEALIETLAERLMLRGISAQWVTTPEAAYNILRHQTFDVAVLDVTLPHTNGFDLKRKMTRMAPEMKFIFMTGHDLASRIDPEDTALKNTDTKSLDYLLKPVDIDRLVEKIRAITGRDE